MLRAACCRGRAEAGPGSGVSLFSSLMGQSLPWKLPACMGTKVLSFLLETDSVYLEPEISYFIFCFVLFWVLTSFDSFRLKEKSQHSRGPFLLDGSFLLRRGIWFEQLLPQASGFWANLPLVKSLFKHSKLSECGIGVPVGSEFVISTGVWRTTR